MMSACGVLCSECPAYFGREKGFEHQQRTVEAWQRIYDLHETADHISCGGCLGPDEKIFHSSIGCKARNCCRNKELNSCAECSFESCPDLEKAQSVWDDVPNFINKISTVEFDNYARPYLGHRERIKNARELFFKRT